MRSASIWQRALASGVSSDRPKPATSIVPATRRLSPSRLIAHLTSSSMALTQGASSGFSNLKVAL
jgi:hypothetical protein